MGKHKKHISDASFSLIILAVSLVINIGLQSLLNTQSFVSDVFILGMFFISLKTHGYLGGSTASLLSMLIVNFVFTPLYYELDFVAGKNLPAAIIMYHAAHLDYDGHAGAPDEPTKMEKERMCANLLCAASHDLRPPPATIYGLCPAVIENNDPLQKEQQLKLPGNMQQDSEWLIRRVKNLLSVACTYGEKANAVKSLTVLKKRMDAVLLKFRKRDPEQEEPASIPEDFISISKALLMEQVLANIK